MASFFSKKWEQIQVWLQTTAIQNVKHSISKERLKQPLYTILCVDDDPDFCLYIQHIASSLRIQLIKAYTLAEAKQKMEQHPPFSAYLIDGHLPDGSGFELIAWIREEKESKAPLAFISRIYQDAHSFRLLKENFQVNYVLDKPLSPLEVKQLLTCLCSSPFPEKTLLHHAFNGLKESYQRSIFDKIERLEKMIIAVQKNPSRENFQALKTEVHKIAGSASSYGYLQVSELCKNLEEDLTKQIGKGQQEAIDREWLAALDYFFTQIKWHFQIQPLTEKKSSSLTHHQMPSIYIVDENQTLLDFLNRPETNRQLDILIENQPEKAVQQLASAALQPQILLVNAHYATSKLTGYNVIEAFYQQKNPSKLAVGLVVEVQALEDQVEAIQKGIAFILGKPISVHTLLPLLEQISSKASVQEKAEERQKEASIKKEVIIIHEEVNALKALQMLLEEKEFKVTQHTKLDEDLIASLLKTPTSDKFPLFILIGALAETQGLFLLKKLNPQNKNPLPFLYLPTLAHPTHLQQLLEKLNYFNKPFNLMVMIAQ